MAQNLPSIYDYKLFNATDIKSFIINQMKEHGNTKDIEIFKDVNYIGSNMNAFIDTIAVILQQLLFHMSMNAAETAFSTAQLYESMNKIVSILNYKPSGKQTSILPVQMLVDTSNLNKEAKQFTIPRFLQITHNSPFVLKREIVKDIPTEDTQVLVDAALFQGSVQQSQIYTAIGDEFERFILNDPFISSSRQFISDNFFSVYVKHDEEWEEYTETSSIFLENEKSKVYERRFNEDYNYEFKFGNGTNGVRLSEGDEVVIFYIISDGEDAIIGDGDVINDVTPSVYSSPTLTEIINNNDNSISPLLISVHNTGPSTAITYPESVESMRNNAPRVFASQNRLFSLGDYYTFIRKNFTSYCRDLYVMSNNSYTEQYIKYYYDLGIDSPNKDSRLNLAQVNFMTACNFNNVYAVILPLVNTIISDKIPNYLNTAFKQEIVERTEPYRGLTHNLVILDPIYRAFTFGSTLLEAEDFNEEQLQNKLYVVRDRRSKFSQSFIKRQVVNMFTNYFRNLSIGEQVDVSYLTSNLLNIQGVTRFYIQNIYGGNDYNMSLYSWNPLYSSEDNIVSQQTLKTFPFQFCYFYDLSNIANNIIMEDE